MRARLTLATAAACAVAIAIAVPASAHRDVSVGSATDRARAGQPAPMRVWPLGDSITLGVSAPTWTPGGYRTALDQILSHDGVTHRFVGTSSANSSLTLDENGQIWHDGHGGYRIDQVLSDLDGVAHADTDGGGRWLTGTGARRGLGPDVVLIHLGTNDIVQDWDTRRFLTHTGRADLSDAKQRALFVADMTARLGALVARIHQLRPTCRIVAATIMPITMSNLTSVVSGYAGAVRHLVSRLRAEHLPVSLADVYAAFTVSPAPGSPAAPGLVSNDNIHPTAAGYTVIARTFASAIES